MSVDLTAFNWRKLVLKSNLPANAKYLCLYLSTWMNENQDVAWPSMARISGETGLTKQTVRKYVDVLEGQGWLICKRNSREWLSDGGAQKHNEYWISVPTGVVQAIADDFQRGANSLPPITKGGQSDSQRGVISSPKGGKEITPNKQVITKNSNGGHFVPPTLDEVRSYCQERGNAVNPSKWIDHYQSVGWKVGRNPMKDWKAAVRKWEDEPAKPNGSDYGKGAI